MSKILCLIGKSNALYNAINYTIQNFPEQKIIVVPAQSDIEIDTWQYSIKRLCIERKIKTCLLSELYEISNLVIISIQFDLILKPELFKTEQIYNIHFSLLPKYKGVYPAIWPIIDGEKESGVTLHKIDAGIDTGDIIDQKTIEIKLNDTARNLYHNCINAAFLLYKENIEKLIADNFVSLPQSPINSIYYSKKSIDFGNIKYNLNRTAFQIHNQIRGLNFREFQLPVLFERHILKSEILNEKSDGKPGSIVSEDKQTFIIINTVDFKLKIYFDNHNDLFLACREGELDLFNKTLPLISDLEIMSKEGWTALMIAVFSNNKEITTRLVNAGANVNATNYKGTSVLMYAKTIAAKTNNFDILDILITGGANLSICDNKGIGILEYARKEGNQNVITYLTSKLTD